MESITAPLQMHHDGMRFNWATTHTTAYHPCHGVEYITRWLYCTRAMMIQTGAVTAYVVELCSVKELTKQPDALHTLQQMSQAALCDSRLP